MKNQNQNPDPDPDHQQKLLEKVRRLLNKLDKISDPISRAAKRRDLLIKLYLPKKEK